MAMTYEQVAKAVQQGGSIYFVLLFVAALIYALWPRNRATFDRAAQAPFDEEDPHGV
jgi:cytochrome c oxidase cbb3-type subunit 4